jgi:DNA-binding NarL/FixJ family response regulator
MHTTTAVAQPRRQRLAQACEGARTPAPATLTAPPKITRRQREILTLAASGLSNGDIAQRLVVPVRTVENHLYRASNRLGISNRTELATLIEDVGAFPDRSGTSGKRVRLDLAPETIALPPQFSA